MSDPRNPHLEADAANALALLATQADELRADLSRLRQELSSVQREIDENRADQLLQSNGMLVIAALRAEAIAEKATRNLRKFKQASERDTLTHTANRTLMLKRMTRAIEKSRRKKHSLAVFFIDLDHFRHINQTLGHAGGDHVLKLVARRLEWAVQDAGLVSRHGGDEFLMLFTSDPQAPDAAAAAEKILSAIAVPCSVGEVVLHLSASIGIALYPENGEDVTTLIDRADAAMFRSKRIAPGHYRFWDASMSTDTVTFAVPHGLPLSLSEHHPSPPLASAQVRDLREANEQLVLAALNAQQLESHALHAHSQQIKFMAIAAHELRNPLTPIRVAASLLIDRDADEGGPSLERLQTIIDSQVTHMSRLISDLLDGSRISTGKLRIERRDVDLVDIVNAAVESSLPGMNARQQTIAQSFPPGPITLHGDPIRLMQIFSNLLDNASKYTPASGVITLNMALSERSLTVTIADNGIGITSGTLPHIFDLFNQDGRSLAHSNGGLGIGLAIVRDLVEAHGGTVTATSEGLGQGSAFVVMLPYQPRVSLQRAARTVLRP